jgi:hypothetical protein
MEDIVARAGGAVKIRKNAKTTQTTTETKRTEYEKHENDEKSYSLLSKRARSLARSESWEPLHLVADKEAKGAPFFF